MAAFYWLGPIGVILLSFALIRGIILYQDKEHGLQRYDIYTFYCGVFGGGLTLMTLLALIYPHTV